MARPNPVQPSRYPVYQSPDGETEQVAPTPAREAQLKFAGWTKVTVPRTRPANAAKPQPPDSPPSVADQT
jgi:hypothetical protein